VRRMVKRDLVRKNAHLWRFVKHGCLLILFLANCQGCVTNARDAHIKKLVRDLRDGPLGPISLGTVLFPSRCEITEQLISYGEEAVPSLIEALNSENPVCVGHAAYCLKEIGTSRGVPEAEAALDRLRKSSEETIEVRFARSNLEAFLSPAKEAP